MGATLTDLKDRFERAKRLNHNFVAVVIEVDGHAHVEILITDNESIDTNLNYYMQAYTEDLVNKRDSGIRITCITSGDTFEELQNKLGL